MDLIEIAIHIDLEHCAGMESRASGLCSFCLKAKTRDIQLVDKDINNPSEAVFIDIIIDAFGKQGGWVAILSFDKPAPTSPLR